MRHVRGQQPRGGLLLSHDRKVSPRGTFQASRNRWIPETPNSFGLPAGDSCPGRTSFCNACYAERSEKRMKGVGDNMRHNLDLLLAAGTVDAMAELLDEMLDRYHAEAERRNFDDRQRIFRIHWDGDFFSLDYARAWAQVLPSYPDVQFWCYTRSFTDPVNVVPILRQCSNLTVYLSVDADNFEAAHQVATADPGVMLAYSSIDYATARAELAHPDRAPLVPCPENDSRKKIPLMTDGVGACVTCGLCVTGRRDIGFATSHRENRSQPVAIRPRSSVPLIRSAGMASTRDQIIQYITDQGGALTSDDGFGITRQIAEHLGTTTGAITQHYAKLEADGLIGRRQNGKRLYAVYLAGQEPAAAATPAPARAPKPAPAAVKVTRMRCGQMIDAAKERTTDKVIHAAFDRIEDELAADSDEMARLKRVIADQRAEIDALRHLVDQPE